MAVHGGAELDTHVDVPDLHELYAALKGMEGNLRVSMRRRLVGAAKPVVEAVKAEASWSTRIPKAVKAKASFSAKSAGVTIVVDAKKAPEARPLEHGGKDGKFRHRVFGHDSWVDQPARPFYFRPIVAAAPKVTAEMEAVLSDVAREAGFH